MRSSVKLPIVIGNWKLNGSLESGYALLAELKESLRRPAAAEFVVCPPFVYLFQFREFLAGSSIGIGAQNVCDRSDGAFTGEISAPMLSDAGCRYVIVGHIERRTLYHEDNALVGMKFRQVQSAGLVPVLCVGETLEQRNRKIEHEVVTAQLQACCDGYRGGELVVAYEPGWAIGTGRVATPRQVEEMHRFIYEKAAALFTADSSLIRVVYGGSIKADNVRFLFGVDGVDGGLVGGASLDAAEFALICSAACVAVD